MGGTIAAATAGESAARAVQLRAPLAAVLLSAALAACSGVAAFDDPRVSIEPQLVYLEVNGDSQLASGGGGGSAQVDLDELGAGATDAAFGGTFGIGDGFSGFDIGYLDLDSFDTGTGTLSADWGSLLAGDVVRTEIDGYEVRVRALGQVLELETERERWLRLGLGGTLAHRELEFRAREINGARQQDVDLQDHGVVYLSSRLAAGWVGFQVRADYGLSPESNFGGDFDGWLHDAELTFAYTFPGQEVSLSAGYRYTTLQAQGTQRDLDYEFDFRLQGIVLGVELLF
jgi:hypothetical protein